MDFVLDQLVASLQELGSQDDDGGGSITCFNIKSSESIALTPDELAEVPAADPDSRDGAAN